MVGIQVYQLWQVLQAHGSFRFNQNLYGQSWPLSHYVVCRINVERTHL
jgi:hypothetical protein